ncbi:hypothetical protein E2C01_052710 [Portunus trituberculatus]|uniref:Uncharacterized protein n=1 Tax=Portunus trituberculatus TaxID=210409 RepID=A0A5B7GQ42_PORTR|nr:hypothetical protein [Portunus trituberculatus]
MMFRLQEKLITLEENSNAEQRVRKGGTGRSTEREKPDGHHGWTAKNNHIAIISTDLKYCKRGGKRVRKN